jgi:hypothetical protein
LKARFTQAWRNVCLLDGERHSTPGQRLVSIVTFFNVDPHSFREALDKEGVLVKKKGKIVGINSAFRVGITPADVETAATFLKTCATKIYTQEVVGKALAQAGYDGLDAFKVLQSICRSV